MSDFIKSLSAAQSRLMRAGVIQNFEFCYEISWKMFRRQLQQDEGVEEVGVLSRKDLYRLAAQKGLLDDPEAWFIFHKARNETSHTYNEHVASEVYKIALDFLVVAQSLLKKLLVR